MKVQTGKGKWRSDAFRRKKDYCVYETSFCINLMATTHTYSHAKSKTDMHHIKKEETEGKVIEHHQIKQHTETQGKRDNRETELPENKR